MVFRSLPWSSPAQPRLEKKAPWVFMGACTVTVTEGDPSTVVCWMVMLFSLVSLYRFPAVLYSLKFRVFTLSQLSPGSRTTASRATDRATLLPDTVCSSCFTAAGSFFHSKIPTAPRRFRSCQKRGCDSTGRQWKSRLPVDRIQRWSLCRIPGNSLLHGYPG